MTSLNIGSYHEESQQLDHNSDLLPDPSKEKPELSADQNAFGRDVDLFDRAREISFRARIHKRYRSVGSII